MRPGQSLLVLDEDEAALLSLLASVLLSVLLSVLVSVLDSISSLIIGFVETGTFENNPRTGPDQASAPPAACRTFHAGLRRHRVKYIQRRVTSLALIRIGRHVLKLPTQRPFAETRNLARL
jgi:hypothetical protein